MSLTKAMTISSNQRKSPTRLANRRLASRGFPKLKDFISKRDYTGALVLLDFNRNSEHNEIDRLLWVGYCAFHLGDYEKAQNSYIDLLSGKLGEHPKNVPLYLACVYISLRMYEEAEESANSGPEGILKNRLLFHISQTNGRDSKVSMRRRLAIETEQDHLSLVALKYVQGQYQEVIDVCKRLLIENRENLALHYYVAMCYFKMDYYDVSLEMLKIYLQTYPSSYAATNLKACNHYHLYNGKAAEEELKILGDGLHVQFSSDLLRHNMVVFSNGEKALQILPPLLDVIPEARLNLGIHYLKTGAIEEADSLLKDLDPSTSQEYIIKAVIHAKLGQKNGNSMELRKAQTLFQAVGASPSECDTIPGRKCMASSFFLLKQFEDVNVYLESVKSYMNEDDNFHWNYGLSLAMTRNFKAAEETLLLVKNEKYKKEFCYVSCLSRALIMNGKPGKAWELYLELEDETKSFYLLQLIANDCYQKGQFLFAARAFNELEKMDSDPEFWEGKRGACMGVFQEIIAATQRGNLSDSSTIEYMLTEITTMMSSSNNPQAEYIAKVVQNWIKENGLKT